MAATVFQSDFTVQHWASTTLQEAEDKLFFNAKGMMGPGADSIIQQITELNNKPGDNVTFQLQMNLSGSGVTGDAKLRESEEAMLFYPDNITVNLQRFGVEEPGMMAQKKVVPQVRARARNALALRFREWKEQRMINHLIGLTTDTFPAAALAPSANRVIYAGKSVTSVDTFTAHARYMFTVQEALRAKDKAVTASPRIRPIRTVDGEDVYVMLLHPWQAYHMKYGGTDEWSKMWRDSARDAADRGKSNPLFTGAIGMFDGVVFHVHPMLPERTNTGSVSYSTAVLLGQQALGVAVGSAPFFAEEKIDYDNRRGHAFGQILGFKKLVFNSEDYGVIAVHSAIQAPAGTDHV